MQLNLLRENYMLKEEIYEDFRNNNIKKNIKYFSNDYILLENVKPFPIYMAIANEDIRKSEYLEAFSIIEKVYIDYDRDIIFSQRFWHSLLVLEFRDFLLEKYPQIINDRSAFENIVLKKFNWENYIYKSLLAVQYVCDNASDINDKVRLYNLILDNLDVFNYLIKYHVFRNDIFILNVLNIIDETNLSELLKKKIPNRSNLGDDERYGRRIIFELNKSYPVIMSPMLDYRALKELFLSILHKYY